MSEPVRVWSELLRTGARRDKDVLLHIQSSGAGEAESSEAALFGARNTGGEYHPLDWNSAWRHLATLDRNAVVAHDDAVAGIKQYCPEDPGDAPHHEGLGVALLLLLPPSIRDRLMELAALDGGPRVFLHVESGLVAGLLPWEQLGTDGVLPFLSGRLRLVHYIPVSDPIPEDPGLAETFRVLILVSGQRQGAKQPSSEVALRDQITALESGLSFLPGTEVVVARPGGMVFDTVKGWDRPVRRVDDPQSLTELLEEGFDIVHLVGHSKEEETQLSIGTRQVTHRLAVGWRFQFPRTATAPSAAEQDFVFHIEELRASLRHGRTRLLVLSNCSVERTAAVELLAVCEHVIGMSIQVTPELTEAWAQAFYPKLLEDLMSRGDALASSREALGPRQGGWVPRHWSRTCRDGPMLDPDAHVLRKYLKGVRTACSDIGYLFRELLSIRGSDELSHYVDLEYESADLALAVEQAGWHDDPGRRSAGTPIEALGDPLAARLRTGARPHVLLLGPPGAGKTSALKRIAFHLAQQEGRRIPVLEELWTWTTPEFGILHGLDRGDYGQYSDEERARLERLLENARLRGDVVYLLDAFDELDERAGALGTRIPEGNCTVILSCRQDTVEHRVPPTFQVQATLKGLPWGRQQEALRLWLGDPADAAIGFLDRKSGLRSACRTPLFLCLFAVLWKLRSQHSAESVAQDFPMRRGELYREAVTQLIQHKHKANRPGTRKLTDGEEITRYDALQWLALHASCSSDLQDEEFSLPKRPEDLRRELLAGDLRAFVQEHLSERASRAIKALGGLETDAEPLNLTEAFREAGFLIRVNSPASRSHWRFRHKTLREALTADLLQSVALPPGSTDGESIRGRLDRIRALTLGTAEQPERERRERLNLWSESLALVTDWLPSDELRTRWARDLHGEDHDLGIRILAASDDLPSAAFVAILNQSEDSQVRQREYRRRLEEHQGSLEAMERDVRALLNASIAQQRGWRDAAYLVGLYGDGLELGERKEGE